MKIKVDWYNLEKTIILQKRESGWTWEDFDAAVDQYVELAKSVENNVALLVDCLDAPTPPSTSVLGHYSRAGRLRPDNLIRMVIVSEEGGFMKTMGDVYDSITRGAFLHFARTMEEGEVLCLEALASSDPDPFND